jgi:cell division protein FtsL
MMTTAEWYEHHNRYRKYGIEMKEYEQEPEVEAQNSSVTIQDKFKIILLLLFVGFLCVSVIISAAYVATVRHEINTITRQSADIRGKIENLNVEIERATNIRIIEERAKNELGMIYPSGSEIVFLSNDVWPEGDFAMRLREQASN